MELWEKVKNLFKEAEASSATMPIIHKIIERSDSENQFREKFVDSLTHRRLNDWLLQQYSIHQSHAPELDESISFLKSTSVKGFVIHLRQTRYNTPEIVAFFDHLKERVLDLGYKSYVSDSKQYNKEAYAEELQRHYLKPPLKLAEVELNEISQKFGNINIELLMRNGAVWHLKFAATVYRDRKYLKAEEFEELMKALVFPR